MKILIIFAGQGTHEDNLFDYFSDHKPSSQTITKFSEGLGFGLIEHEKHITNPVYAPQLIAGYQFTLFSSLVNHLTTHSIDVAGYSLGEVSAFLGSSQASPEMAAKVIAFRTKIMAKAIDLSSHDLLSLSGNIKLQEVASLCQQHGCYIAIVNPSNIILGGTLQQLNALLGNVDTLGVTKHTFLEIKYPSHTPIYKGLKNKFSRYLATLFQGSLEFPVLSPIALRKIYDTSEEIKLLDNELYSTLNWSKVIDLVSEYQYDLIIDLGPGSAISSMLLAQNGLSPYQIITASNFKHFTALESHLLSKLK